jgi:hypothetical protein
MATTVTAPVDNNIALASRYLPFLDEIYKAESKTSIFDTAEDRVRWIGAKTVMLFATDPVGLSAYSRNAGFVPGDVDGSWESYTISQDRGRSFLVDTMDNDETLGMAFGTLASEFERIRVVPELDAYRFAKYATSAAAANKITETLSTAAATITSIDDATAQLDDAEVPYEGRILFVNPTTYKMIKAGITRMVMNDDRNVNYNVEIYNDMRVITVPSGRFNTAITINAPTTSGDMGGYTATGSTINYMIAHPSAIMQTVKHVVPSVFSPEVNQEADAWKFDYRVYHDAFVKTNKTNGILVSAPAVVSG